MSKLKPLIETIQARPACVVEAWHVYRKSVDASRDRHPSERGHHDGSQAKARTFERRIHERLALFVLLLGKLDDQNRVLGGNADHPTFISRMVNCGNPECMTTDPAFPAH